MCEFIAYQSNIDLDKKEDFKYKHRDENLVPQSIQVFEFNTGKSSQKIKEILQEYKKNQEDYPKIIQISESKGIVRCSIQIWKGEEILHYDITLKSKENFLIVQGRGDGRGNINRFLADLIENDTTFNIIREHQLTVKQMLFLFDKLVKENNRAIITHLKVQFEPLRGFEYERETYTELSYKFIENRCASKHRDFKEICKNGKRMNMSLSLIHCVGIIEETLNVGKRIDVTPSCTFRMYNDVPSTDWDEFCFKILDFL